jgi:hypothetical protein
MIISHQYKYLFVEMDHTGSTAISRELCEYYGGEEILWKHARYADFLQQASPEEKQYFCFSGRRHPLDLLVTLYFYHKADHHQRLDNLASAEVSFHNYRWHHYLNKYQTDFPTFFKKFFGGQIYYEWKSQGQSKLNYLYRFEELPEEFVKLLDKLALEPHRTLPLVNQTPERAKDFLLYYPPALRGWAQIILRDLMADWEYEFPADWQNPSLGLWLYYYLWLKPLFYLRQIWHSLIDQPIIYRRLFVEDSGPLAVLHHWSKQGRAKILAKFN